MRVLTAILRRANFIQPKPTRRPCPPYHGSVSSAENQIRGGIRATALDRKREIGAGYFRLNAPSTELSRRCPCPRLFVRLNSLLMAQQMPPWAVDPSAYFGMFPHAT